MPPIAIALSVALSLSAASFAQCLLSFDAPRAAGGPILELTPAAAGFDGTFLFMPPKDTNGDEYPDIDPVGAGDFDGNGIPDAALPKAIYLDFRTRVALPLNTSESVLRVADVNRDGRADLIAASQTELVVLINSGSATFVRKSTPITFLEKTTLLFADFNADGLLDFLVMRPPVYLGNGDGTFKSEEEPVEGGGRSRWLAADVDGDRLPDLVAIGDTQLTIFRRLTKGFAPGVATLAAGSGGPIAVADFNRDGRDDFLFANGTLMFNAGGTSSLANSRIAITGKGFIGDFNGDGAPDFLDRTAGGFRIHLNDGLGNLQIRDDLQGMPRIVVLGTVGPPSNDTVTSLPLAADMDGDAILDLVVSRASDRFVLRGNGDGTFRVPRVAFAAADSGAAGDFDGDGDDDVALPAAIAWNHGDNTFHIAPVADDRLRRVLRSADVNGDGKAEVLAASDTNLFVLALRPDGSIVESARIPVNAVDAGAGDFSASEVQELAVLVETAEGRAVQVVEIRTGAVPRWTGPNLGMARSIGVADLNADGADDVIVTGGTLDALVWNRPRGSRDGFLSVFLSTRGSFEIERRNSYDAALDDLATGDFDGDGKPDVAAGTLMKADLHALFGDGLGGFAREQTIHFVSQEDDFNLRAADFDGDGMTDLAVNGAWRIFRGGAAGLAEHGGYFGPQDVSWSLTYVPESSYFPFIVRSRRGALPSIVVAVRDAAEAFVYRPVCSRSRSVRR